MKEKMITSFCYEQEDTLYADFKTVKPRLLHTSSSELMQAFFSFLFGYLAFRSLK